MRCGGFHCELWRLVLRSYDCQNALISKHNVLYSTVCVCARSRVANIHHDVRVS